MVFFVLQLPGAQGTGRPLTTSVFLVPIILQHIQLAWLLQGTVGPHLPPKARDFNTASLFPTLDAVFLTNWNRGLWEFLKESVRSSSSSALRTDFTSFSSFPLQDIISMGLDESSSSFVFGRSRSRSILRTFSTIFFKSFVGYSEGRTKFFQSQLQSIIIINDASKTQALGVDNTWEHVLRVSTFKV